MTRWTEDEKAERDYIRAMEADLRLRERMQERTCQVISAAEMQHRRTMAALRKGVRPGRTRNG